jgi:hypothetical protein
MSSATKVWLKTPNATLPSALLEDEDDPEPVEAKDDDDVSGAHPKYILALRDRLTKYTLHVHLPDKSGAVFPFTAVFQHGSSFD